MRPLLITCFFLSLFLSYSCDKEVNDTKEKKEKVEEEVEEEDSIEYHALPTYGKSFFMRDKKGVDTLYYNKGEYSTELLGFGIYGSIIGSPTGYHVTENDTIIKIGNKVLGRAEFYPNTYIKSIEMYNWFTLSEINVNGQKAFEVRSIGTNPDSLLIVISVHDRRLDGPLFYAID